MDKEIIKKYGLTEEINRLRTINEYTFITKPTLDEDDDEGMNGNGGEIPQQSPQGGQQTDTSNDGNGNTEGQPPMPQMDLNPENDEVGGVGTDLPQEDSEEGEQPTDNDVVRPMEGGDEVIDVEELTQSQDDTKEKVDMIGSKLDNIISTMQKYTDAITKSDDKVALLAGEIANLQSELERRAPTPEEKLNIRSQSAYPFQTSPRQFWDSKNADQGSNYRAVYTNDNPAEDNADDHKYDILSQDIDNLNVKEVSDSIDNLPDLEDFLGNKRF